MVNSCRKGKAAEREVANRLEPYLGFKLHRNLEQQRSGGYDLEGLPALAIEVKDDKSLSVAAMWRQCVKQAEDAARIPVLIYKIPRKGWQVRLPASSFTDLPTDWSLEGTVQVSLGTFGNLCSRYWVEDSTSMKRKKQTALFDVTDYAVQGPDDLLTDDARQRLNSIVERRGKGQGKHGEFYNYTTSNAHMLFETYWCDACRKDDIEKDVFCPIICSAVAGEETKELLYQSGHLCCTKFEAVA